MAVPKMVITAALTIANMALTASRKIEGPRLDDTSFTGGDPGGPRQRIWGTVRSAKDAIWGDELREIKRQRKTKGGKFNDYTYLGSWAVEVACHPIAAVSRIWFDTHLVLDLTGAGPVAPFDFATTESSGGKGGGSSSGGGFDLFDHLTIYLGTEDQEPDPRIEAEVDARIGIEGATPAYRNTAYIALKDLPLEKFGNRIPQVSVEAVTSADPALPFEDRDSDIAGELSRLWNASFSPDFSRFMWVDGSQYEIWDVASRSRLISGTLSQSLNLSNKLGLRNDGSFYAVTSDDEALYLFTADGLSGVKVADFPNIPFDQRWQQEVRVVADGNGAEHWLTIPFSFIEYWYLDGIEYTMAELVGDTWLPTTHFSDGSSVWTAGRAAGTGQTTAYIYRSVAVDASGSGYLEVEGLAAQDGGLGGCDACWVGDGFTLLWDNRYLYRVDAAGSVTATRDLGGVDVYNAAKQFANLPSGASSIFLNQTATILEVDLVTLETIRELVATDWVSDNYDGLIYDPINHALIGADTGATNITWRYLDRIQSVPVTLGTIVAEVCELAGLSPGDYDTSALTQEVRGYGVSMGSGKDWLVPLLDLYDVDARPHGFGLQFVPRGGASLGTIAFDDFARPDGESEPFYRFPNAGGTDVPRELVLKFKDVAGDQQPNSALSGPVAVADGVGEKTLDMSNLVLEAADAKQLVARYHRRMAFDARAPGVTLPASRIALEPADRYTLALSSGDIDARLVAMELGADGRMECEWARDDASVALLDGSDGAGLDAHVPAAIVIPLPSKGFILDIPLLQDADSSANPRLYTAAGPYATGAWPGATFFASLDGEYSDEFDSAASNEAATWGYANGALASANPGLWDRGNEVNVTIQTGELSGASEQALNADPSLNLCLLGEELLQFSTAVLEGDGTYTLSGFRRGRRGTEWAIGSHVAGDIFLLLETADPQELGLSEVGTALSYKTITAGRTDGFITDIAFIGASLKPYAPVHLKAVKEDNGDWTFAWVRRTRVGGAWTSGTSIPLSEASEEYQIAVGDGVSSDTKTVTSASYTWTLADQTADTGGEVLAGSLEWSVAQVSDAVGAGFLAAA